MAAIEGAKLGRQLRNRIRSAAPLSADYAPVLTEIKARVQSARVKTGLAANRELLALDWDIGRLMLDRQRRGAWGAKVIPMNPRGKHSTFNIQHWHGRGTSGGAMAVGTLRVETTRAPDAAPGINRRLLMVDFCQ